MARSFSCGQLAEVPHGEQADSPEGTASSDLPATPDLVVRTGDSASRSSATPEELEAERQASNETPSCGGSARLTRAAKMRREVRLLLNEISPENEELISSQLAGMQLSEARDFDTVAGAILDKAMEAPLHAELYARASNQLVQTHAALPKKAGEEGDTSSAPDGCHTGDLIKSWAPASSSTLRFSEAVLGCCGRTFDKFFGQAATLEGGPACRTGGSDQPEGEAARMKARAVAFVRMLGHLHKVGIVRAVSLQQCMGHLLIISQEEHELVRPPKAWVECACEILITAGKHLSRTTQGRALLKVATARLEWLAARDTAYPPSIVRKMIDAVGAGNLDRG